MAALRLIGLAFKLKRGWSRIPPAQRKKMLKQAQKHGPKVIKQAAKAMRKAQ